MPGNIYTANAIENFLLESKYKYVVTYNAMEYNAPEPTKTYGVSLTVI